MKKAKLNIGVCNGFGLENLFRGRCKWGKYCDNEALFLYTQTGEKVVVFAGGGTRPFSTVGLKPVQPAPPDI